MVAIKSRHVGSGNQEPTWLLDIQNVCQIMYGKLVAVAFKANAVNTSVTQRSKTQGAANQARSATTSLHISSLLFTQTLHRRLVN